MYKKKNTLIKFLIVAVIVLVILNACMILAVCFKKAEERARAEEMRKTETIAKLIETEAEETTQMTEAPVEEPIVETTDVNTEKVSAEQTEAQTAERNFYDSVPLYFQTDYPGQRFGEGSVKSDGSSITSLAMVASYMTGYAYMPDTLAEYFGGYGQNNMERLEYASDVLQLPWTKAQNVHDAIRAVRAGKIAIVMMNPESIFTDDKMHFIVLSGTTEDGKLTVNDPNAQNYTKWDLKNALQIGFEDGDIVCGYSGGWIYDIGAMPEEPFFYSEEKVYVEPRYPGLELTWEERQLLAKVIWLEARGESKEGQQAIAEVVFNRMVSEDFSDSLKGIIFAELQFRSVDFLEEAEPSQAQYDAIDDALNGPYVLPIDVVHFATYPVNDNVWGTIGGHIFCYRWKNN